MCHDVYKIIQEFIGECCPREVDSEYQSLNFLKCDLSLKSNSNSFLYQLYQVLSRHRGFSYNQIYAAVAFIKEDYAFNEISQHGLPGFTVSTVALSNREVDIGPFPA